jgi:hypothetical protein
MFFSLCNSSAIFQSMMNDIFQDYVNKRWLHIYMDNLLLCRQFTEDIQQKTLRMVRCLQENDLFLKLEKCKFDTSQIKFLGMIISHNKIDMNLVKVQGILNWPTPEIVKQVRGFLGFENFYRQFINYYSDIVRTLIKLIRKNVLFA